MHSVSPDHTPLPRNTAAGSEGARAILAAAEQLFARKGYDAVSISAIAQAAGVSKANVFHHFGTKKALYLEVLRTACDNESTRLLKALPQQPGTRIEHLQQFVAAHLDALLRHERRSRLIQREIMQGSDQRGKELAEEVFGENFNRLLDLIAHGQREGQIRQELDPALIAVLLVAGNVFFFEAHKVLRHFPQISFADDPGRYSQQVMDLLLHGIRPPLPHHATSR